ncbi:MAG: hypothetical protein ACLTSZ_15115 [Lachnospiraceae bacterium]
MDGLMIILSYLLAWFLMLRSVEGKEIGVLPPEFYMMVLVVLVPFFLLLYYACNLYTPKRVQGRRLEGSNIVKANIIGGLTLMAAYFFLQLPNVSRLQIGLFLLLNVIFLFVERNVVRIILMRFRKSGLNLKHIVLVGYSRAAEEYIDRIVQNPQWGYKVMGILDDRVVAGTEYRGIGVLGTIGSLSALLEVNHPDEIAITLGLSEVLQAGTHRRDVRKGRGAHEIYSGLQQDHSDKAIYGGSARSCGHQHPSRSTFQHV